MDWRRVKEAGVTFWYNDKTGVATDECPHESLKSRLEREILGDKTDHVVPQRFSDGGNMVGPGEGTGALVYDSSEYHQAVKLLDSAAHRKSPMSVT